jgi:mRNA interferase RelE/StbE
MPTKYTVTLVPSAERELRALPTDVVRRVVRKLEALAVDPRPRDVRKLEGSDDHYRIRVGDYRIVYQVVDAELVVLVVRVRHRRDVYR